MNTNNGYFDRHFGFVETELGGTGDVSITSNTPYITALGTVLSSDMLIYDSTKNIMQIGDSADLDEDASNLNLVAYGNDLTINATHTTNSVFIGDTIGVGGPYDLAFQNTAVGNNITVGRSNNTIIGYNNQTYEYGNQVTLLGSNLTCLYDDCILIGDSITATGSDQLEIGHWFSGSPAATSINETLSLMYTLDDFSTSPTVKLLCIETNNIVGFRDLPTAGESTFSQVQYTAGAFGHSGGIGTWVSAPLNTTVFDDIGTTLSSSAVILPAGTYIVKASICLWGSATAYHSYVARIYNQTKSEYTYSCPILLGQDSGLTNIVYKFTHASPCTIYVQGYTDATAGNLYIGRGSNPTGTSVFTDVMIEKLP